MIDRLATQCLDASPHLRVPVARRCLCRRMGGMGMACACAWWVSAVGVGATTGVVTVTMPSYKLQVIQVTTGKRLRGWTYSGRPPPCGAERISGVFVCARAPRPPLEGVGARMALSPGRPVVYSTAELVRIAMFSWGGIGAARPERVHFGKRCQFRLLSLRSTCC